MADDKEIASRTLKYAEAGESRAAKGDSGESLAGHGSSRSYPKGRAPSLKADFNPMNCPPDPVDGVNGDA